MGKQWKLADFIFLGSKTTADGDCSHEIKRRLLLGRKVMTNLDSILESRNITLSTEVHLVKAMVFPAVMYGCESWAIKKTECWRIDAFELWCWRRLLRVPWTARRSNQSILKEISPGISLEGMMLKLKLQLWLPHGKSWLIGKDSDAGRDWGQEEKGTTEHEVAGWHHWLDGCVWVNFGGWWWSGSPGLLRFMGLQRVGHNWVTELKWKSSTSSSLFSEFFKLLRGKYTETHSLLWSGRCQSQPEPWGWKQNSEWQFSHPNQE